MYVEIDLRSTATTLVKESDGSFVLKSADGLIVIKLAADALRVVETESLLGANPADRSNYLLSLRLDSPELMRSARVWRTSVIEPLAYAGIVSLDDLLQCNNEALKERSQRIGDRSIQRIRQGLANINAEFGTDFELAPEGFSTVIASPLETEVNTIEEFLASAAANVVFAPGRKTLNAQIVGAFRKALFQAIAEKELDELRPTSSYEGTLWESRARRVIDPLWYKATVRDLIGVDVTRIPHRGGGFNTAVKTWLASVNARFNSSLEFGKKP